MGLAVKIRGMRPGEEAFVFAGWINTQRRTPLAKTMKTSVFAHGLHALIERLLPISTVRVAEYEGKLIGFAALGDIEAGYSGIVHYVYVSEPYRGKGIARKLLTDIRRVIHRYTHMPEPWRNITIPSSWVYDPWAAWVGGT